MKYECAIHGYEPIPKNFHKICVECWHCFVTAEELLEEHNNRLTEMNLPLETSVAEIFICPLCTHDF